MAGAVVALLAVAPARPAAADVLAFEAAPAAACPSRAAFLANVRAHTDLSRFDAEGGRTFAVSFRSAADGAVVGTLSVDNPRAPPSTREVDGATCAEVADALALVVALTIASNARAAAPPVATTTPSDPVPLVPDEPYRPPPKGLDLRPWATYEMSTSFGPAPSPLVGGAGGVGVKRREARSGIHPDFAVGIRVVFEKTVFAVATPSADFVRSFLTVELCPLTAASGRVTVSSCGGGSLGVAIVTGEGVVEASTKTRFWSHAHAGLQGDIGLVGRLVLRLRAAAEIAVTRDDFVFVRPDVFVHRAAAIGATAAVGVALRY